MGSGKLRVTLSDKSDMVLTCLTSATASIARVSVTLIPILSGRFNLWEFVFDFQQQPVVPFRHVGVTLALSLPENHPCVSAVHDAAIMAILTYDHQIALIVKFWLPLHAVYQAVMSVYGGSHVAPFAQVTAFGDESGKTNQTLFHIREYAPQV